MLDISIQNLDKSYGGFDILKSVSFDVQQGSRVGLIGRNGSGKSTLLKIIGGFEEGDGGMIILRKGVGIGYLHQVPQVNDENTVFSVLRSPFSFLDELTKKLVWYEYRFSKDKSFITEQTMAEYGEIQHEYESRGGYEVDLRLHKIITGFGFTRQMLERPFNTLSGGEKSIVELGKVLMLQADILILDEPTNHLDVNALEWLESYLNEYEGTVLIVSHDRYFLDRVATAIVEIEAGEAEYYQGNYSTYMIEKERRRETQIHAFHDQQKQMKQMSDAAKRFRDWGSRGDNKLMFNKARNMEKRIERLEKVERPEEERSFNLSLSGQGRSGKDVFFLRDVCKSYDDKLILNNVDLFVRFGDRIIILGDNGSGKTTLINVMRGILKPDIGKVKIGKSIQEGYLDQEVTFEDTTKTLIEYIRYYFPVDETKARSMLAYFLFTGPEVFKKIQDLSEGEKVRLKLCTFMHQDLNTLVFDEPSNHLDISAREALEDALLQFQGTIVCISHDRYFINKIAEKIVELDEGRATLYEGDYDYYKEQIAERKRNAAMIKEVYEKYKNEKPVQYRTRRERANRKTQIERRINEIEDIVDKKDLEQKEIQKKMAEHSHDYKKLEELQAQHDLLQSEISTLAREWEDLVAESVAYMNF